MKHRGSDPVVLVIRTTVCNRDKMIDGREKLPVDHMRFGHRPIGMKREFRGQQTRQQTNGALKDKLSSRIPINKPVSDEDLRALSFGVDRARRLGWANG